MNKKLKGISLCKYTVQTEINSYEIARKRLARGLQLANERLAEDQAS